MAVSGFLCVQGGPSQKSLHLAVVKSQIDCHNLKSTAINLKSTAINLKSTAEISNRLPTISNRLPKISNRLPKSQIDCQQRYIYIYIYLYIYIYIYVYIYIYIIIEQHTAAAAAVAAAASRPARSAAPRADIKFTYIFFRTKNPRYENCLHFWENVRFWESKNIFNLCSHIELNTQNPNTISKITIYYTKYTNNAKILSK